MILYVVASKCAMNLTCSVAFAATGKYGFAVLFVGCALADLGSILIMRGIV
jgi:hypothetical protein